MTEKLCIYKNSEMYKYYAQIASMLLRINSNDKIN